MNRREFTWCSVSVVASMLLKPGKSLADLAEKNVFGEKILPYDSTALDRVCFRRLFLSIEKHLDQIGRSYVFEPLDEITRDNMVEQMNCILQVYVDKKSLLQNFYVKDITNAEMLNRFEMKFKILLQFKYDVVELEFGLSREGNSIKNG